MKISIIGAGNMAYQLGQALLNADHNIHQNYNRTYTSAQALAKKLNAEPVESTSELDSNIDVLIIAVVDDAIALVAKQLKAAKWNNVLVVHTSGSMGLEALGDLPCTAVFYPFQSMTAGQGLDFQEIPILLTSSEKNALEKSKILAESISNLVLEISDDQRKVIHIAGVVVNNFTNHLFVLAKDLLEENGLSFDILKPLIKNTVKKLDEMDPVQSQTGPAVRGDVKVILDHMEQLKDNKELYDLYGILSKGILSRHEG